MVVLIILISFLTSLLIRASGSTKISSAIGKEMTEPAKLPEVKILNDYWAEPALSTDLVKIVTEKPIGIKISAFTVERGEVGRPSKLAISGLAGSREVLVRYVDILRQDKFFARVDLPVESLLREQGGPFVINLEK